MSTLKSAVYFFKQYCQQIVALMRKRPCSLDGLIDVESNALVDHPSVASVF